jgi:hypothetical protein
MWFEGRQLLVECLAAHVHAIEIGFFADIDDEWQNYDLKTINN